MKEEIAKIYKKKKSIVFNVFNISDMDDFVKKMKKDFEYLDYDVKEEDKEENCLVVEVKMTMAEDFLNIDGCQINNHNIEVYMDVETKNIEKKVVGTWDAPSSKTKKKVTTKPQKTTKRKRLT